MSAASREHITHELRSAGFFLSRRAVIVFLIIALLMTVLLAWWLLRPPRSKRGMDALLSAFSSRRLIEPRLAGGFAAAKLDPSRDNTEGIEELDRARRLIEDSAVYEDSFDSAHVHSRLLVIDGHFPEAERRLRKALLINEQSAALHNDLGVCLMEAEKVEDALEEFDRALQLDSQMSEALFNHALCYERLELRDAAREEYSRIAEMERDQKWRSEIRSRSEKLSELPTPKNSESAVIAEFNAAMAEGRNDAAKEIADKNFDTFNKYALNLTIEHLDAAMAGEKDKSEVAIVKMEQIGEIFIETKGDRFIADAATYLRNLDQEDQEEESKLIHEYSNAIKAAEAENEAEKRAAFERLAKVAESFRARGNDQRALKADIRVANYYYQSNRLGDSIALLEKNLPLVERHEWLNEYANVLNGLSVGYTRLGKDFGSIRFCEKARDIYRKMNENALEAKALQYISFAYSRLGDLDSALQKFRESLHSTILSSPKPSELSYTYSAISNIYRQLGKHKLALLFAQQSLAFAEAAREASRMAQVLMLIALEHAALRQFDDALSNSDKALKLLDKTASGPRAYTEPLALIQAGQIAFQTGNTEQAKDYYDRAVTLAPKTEDNKLLIIDALRGRAKVFAAQRQIERARADADRLVEEIDHYRNSIYASKYRSSFLEASQSAFDEIISLYATTFDLPEEAFNISEQARARSLLDEIEAGKQARAGKPIDVSILKTAAPLTFQQIRLSLPDDLTVIKYAVTEKQTCIFIIRRTGIEVAVSPVGTELIDNRVRHYMSNLKSKVPVEEMTQKAQELYQCLIEPIEGYINQKGIICIVPDKALHFVPFAALIDRSGNYLINSFRLAYAPSASALAYCITEAGKKPANGKEKLLAIGNPEFDSKEFDLPSLPDAEREAIGSAFFYPDPIVLKRGEATESRARVALQECDVAHFALHCMVEEKSPWLSALVLANAKQSTLSGLSVASADDGLLFLDEVSKISLPRTRLVVLSACESGLGHYYRGEGMVSLARPFISAGVPQVIASLWPVASKETSQLMIDFHEERKKGTGKTTVDALREAQLKMASAGVPPFYWASFIAIGSGN